MSSIESVKIYQNNSQISQKQLKNAQRPNFSGTPVKTADELAMEAVLNYKGIDQSLGKIGKFVTGFYKRDGEVQTQITNAFFTATLAPAFIAFNPFSKEDKKTKEYTALRQPISAVTAILFGLGITMPANNFLESIGSKGLIKTIDLRICPNDKYLGRVYDKAKRKGTLEQLKKETFGEKYNGEFNKEVYVSKAQCNAKNTFTKLIYENPSVLKKDSKLKNGIKDFDRYVDENNLHEVSFKTFMQDNYKTKFFSAADGGGLKVAAFKKQSGEIKAMDFLRKAGLVDKYFKEEDLRAFLSKTRSEALRQTLKSSSISLDESNKIADEIGKLTSRQIQYNVNQDMIKEENLTLKQLLESLKIEEEFMSNLENKNLAQVLNDFGHRHLEGLKEVQGKGLKDFAANLMTNKINKTNSYFKNFKGYFGIFVTLLTLPFSCGALNWLYPRIVEKFFPEIANSKSQKGGTK